MKVIPSGSDEGVAIARAVLVYFKQVNPELVDEVFRRKNSDS